MTAKVKDNRLIRDMGRKLAACMSECIFSVICKRGMIQFHWSELRWSLLESIHQCLEDVSGGTMCLRVCVIACDSQ